MKMEEKIRLQIGEIASFEFKAKEEGSVQFGISGDFYDKNANLLNILTTPTRVEVVKIPNTENQKDVKDDNAYLKSIQLNEEGLEPNFNKEIKEYYFIAGKEISNLEITAIPENIEATVNIIGNNEIKEGLNKINIEVISKDKQNKNIYTINVTKTSNIENANANLENLALENTFLNPEFNKSVTNYKADVSNDITVLKLLAIPENRNAKVKITGNEDLQEGINKVVITVTAENGFTTKKYYIDVYRRNNDEEQIFEEEVEKQAERLETVLEKENVVSDNELFKDFEITNENKNEARKNNKYSWIVVAVLVFLLGGSGIYYYKKIK